MDLRSGADGGDDGGERVELRPRPGLGGMDGLHIAFNKQEVLGIRLSSVPPSNPTYIGWGEVVFHFGAFGGNDGGAVSAASGLDVVAGEDGGADGGGDFGR